jgi:aspartate aminotransferase-like enzyme
MDRAVVDHRGPELPEVTWEAALVNTLNSGDPVVVFNNGIFAEKFAEGARKFGAEVDLDELLRLSEAHVNLSLGAGLGRLKAQVFQIGHLGALNELEVPATLSGVELALDMAGERVELGSGVAAAQKWFQEDGW